MQVRNALFGCLHLRVGVSCGTSGRLQGDDGFVVLRLQLLELDAGVVCDGLRLRRPRRRSRGGGVDLFDFRRRCTKSRLRLLELFLQVIDGDFCFLFRVVDL